MGWVGGEAVQCDKRTSLSSTWLTLNLPTGIGLGNRTQQNRDRRGLWWKLTAFSRYSNVQVLEEPTNSSKTMGRRTVMENPKTQIQIQKVIRRLMNTRKHIEEKFFQEILDKYSQKLLNRSHWVRKVLVAGTRLRGGKVSRCKAVRKGQEVHLGDEDKTKSAC